MSRAMRRSKPIGAAMLWKSGASLMEAWADLRAKGGLERALDDAAKGEPVTAGIAS